MNSLGERQAVLALLTEACDSGARLAPACAQIGLSERTVQRWQRPSKGDEGGGEGDLRASVKRIATPPPNRLSQAERQAALALLNSEEFKDLAPSQILPRRADQGRYVASESTLYRLLRGAGQLTHRRTERAPQQRSRPRALVASRPDQIYCWDTHLPAHRGSRQLLLPLLVPRPVQPQDHRLSGVRQRERRPGQPVVDRHLLPTADRAAATDGAL